jgi:diacylglycerol kinase family enzyme
VNTRRLLLVLNRRAGRCKHLTIKREAHRNLWGYRIEDVAPRSREELGAILAGLDPREHAALLLAGGDGTINCALPHLLGKQVPLLPLPVGTANDLAVNLGIRYDWNVVQRLLDTGERARIDLIRVNQGLYATVGGMGVGAMLTHDINESRERSPTFKTLNKIIRSEMYTLMTARTIVFGSGFTHRVRISGEELDLPAGERRRQREIESAVILVCNQSFLGGDLRITDASRNDDGSMEVFVGNVHTRLDLMRMLLDLKRGRHSTLSHVFSARRFSMEDVDGRPIMIFGDGETLLSSPRVDFSVERGALLVVRHAKTSQRSLTAS